MNGHVASVVHVSDLYEVGVFVMLDNLSSPPGTVGRRGRAQHSRCEEDGNDIIQKLRIEMFACIVYVCLKNKKKIM